MHIAVAMEINNRLLLNLELLQSSLQKKSEEFKDIVKIGRTHTQVGSLSPRLHVTLSAMVPYMH